MAQPGDELRELDGQRRRVIRREGGVLWCQDGAMRYKTTVQRWRERNEETGEADQEAKRDKHGFD
jgi:hypothetical protein